jgi:hypothetical protein
VISDAWPENSCRLLYFSWYIKDYVGADRITLPCCAALSYELRHISVVLGRINASVQPGLTRKYLNKARNCGSHPNRPQVVAKGFSVTAKRMRRRRGCLMKSYESDSYIRRRMELFAG